VLPQLAIVSVGLFAAAHLFLFRLHLPNRYTNYSVRLLMAIGGAIAVAILFERLLRTARNDGASLYRKASAIGITLLFSLVILLYPLIDRHFPNTEYVKGEYPRLYEFFQAQPRDTVIASLSTEANNLPTFARRSIFVGSEYAIPYHLGYYLPFQRRVMVLIDALYTPDPKVLKNFILSNRIDYFLLDDSSFDPAHMGKNRLLSQYREISQRIRSQLERGPKPSLQTAASKCPVTRIDRFAVVPAINILEHL
jgi:hypothetical protein